MFFVLIKIRFKVFFRVGTVIASYFICLLTRVLLDIERFINKPVDNGSKSDLEIILRVINTLSNRFKWVTLFYFVLQADNFRIRATAETP